MRQIGDPIEWCLHQQNLPKKWTLPLLTQPAKPGQRRTNHSVARSGFPTTSSGEYLFFTHVRASTEFRSEIKWGSTDGSISRGFRKWGYPQSSSICLMGFSIVNHLATPLTVETPIWRLPWRIPKWFHQWKKPWERRFHGFQLVMGGTSKTLFMFFFVENANRTWMITRLITRD